MSVKLVITNMTPTRLRQIAERLEQVCANYQALIGGNSVACKGCKEAAAELKALAAARLASGPMPVHDSGVPALLEAHAASAARVPK